MAWVKFCDTNSVTIPLHRDPTMQEDLFLKLLESEWPVLYSNLSLATEEERAQQLDMVTNLVTQSIPVEQAYARWYASLSYVRPKLGVNT